MPHSRHLQCSRLHILIKYLYRLLLYFNPLHPPKSALHLQWHPLHPHGLSSCHCCTSSQHLTAKGLCTRCPAQWPVAMATTGCWCSWAQLAGGSAQLLFYRLLHHTLQRLELACCRISYVAFNCIASDSRQHKALMLIYTIKPHSSDSWP